MRTTGRATLNLAESREIKATMAECDRMEAELSEWLDSRANQLTPRTGLPGPTHRGLNAPLWRTLIAIWSMSPAARERYSPGARGGLYSAAVNMQDETLVSLVAGLLREAGEKGRGGTAAA